MENEYEHEHKHKKEHVILVCNNSELIFNKKMYNQYFDSDHFLSLLIKYPQSCIEIKDSDKDRENPLLYNKYEKYEKFTINEDKNLVLSVINSLRFNKLILYDDVCIDYMLEICKMWCMPESLLDQINEKIEENKMDKLNITRDENTYKCELCGCGFKKYENTSTSCKTHDNRVHLGYTCISMVFRWKCCGQKVLSINDEDDDDANDGNGDGNGNGKYKTNYCKIGYHVVKS